MRIKVNVCIPSQGSLEILEKIFPNVFKYCESHKSKLIYRLGSPTKLQDFFPRNPVKAQASVERGIDNAERITGTGTEKAEAKEVTRTVSDLTSNSLITKAGRAHEILVHVISLKLKGKEIQYAPLLVALRKKAYAKALQQACTQNDPALIYVIGCLLSAQKKLGFNINEQVGDKQFTALHHAAKLANRDAYQLLLQNGANLTLRDSTGKTAEEYLVQPQLVI